MKRQKKSPPRTAEWIISRLSYYEKEHALTDAIEADYTDIRARYGAILSWIWYWLCTSGIFFHYIKLNILWNMIMFKNYLKITLRNMRKHKVYSFINISGLAVSIVCCAYPFRNELRQLSPGCGQGLPTWHRYRHALLQKDFRPHILF